jgi:uncharacterized protein (DUF697 family)/uncharacterized tellurite resistance protein B-like protein
MSEAVLDGSEVRASLAEYEEERTRLRDAARHLGAESLRDGSWFLRIVTAHVKKHAGEVREEHWDQIYPGLDVDRRAHEQIKRAAAKALGAGVVASTLASAGGLLSLFTEGLAAPVGIPATLLAMVLEGAYTSLLQIDLACDLASIYGVPFDPDDVGEVATLFAVALGVDLKRKVEHDVPDADAERPHGLTSKLIELEEGEIAKRIGRKMLEDAVIRNVVPVIGIAISARWNYVGTRKLAAAVRKYVRYRRALVHTLARLDLTGVTDPGVLVEGAWLVATADGYAAHEEVMAVALVMDHLPAEARRLLSLDTTFGENELEWFDSLVHLSPHMHDPLLDVLYLIAATDRALGPSERRFLRRVAKTLNRAVDLERVDKICRHLAHGEDLPQGVLHFRSGA